MKVDVKVESQALDNFLENAKSRLTQASQQIIDELAEQALIEIQQNYVKAEYGQAGEYMDFVKTGTEKEKVASMVGPQAWYSEFGTGTYGEMQPHPLKDRFDLDPYNSGKTIRPANEKVSTITDIPVGSLYWTYKDENGEIHYTQGIPAQKEVYDAGRTIQKKIPEVVDKYIRRMF